MPVQEEEGRKRRGRRGRMSPFERVVMAIGYLTIVYLLVRGAVYVAVLLAR